MGITGKKDFCFLIANFHGFDRRTKLEVVFFCHGIEHYIITLFPCSSCCIGQICHNIPLIAFYDFKQCISFCNIFCFGDIFCFCTADLFFLDFLRHIRMVLFFQSIIAQAKNPCFRCCQRTHALCQLFFVDILFLCQLRKAFHIFCQPDLISLIHKAFHLTLHGIHVGKAAFHGTACIRIHRTAHIPLQSGNIFRKSRQVCSCFLTFQDILIDLCQFRFQSVCGIRILYSADNSTLRYIVPLRILIKRLTSPCTCHQIFIPQDEACINFRRIDGAIGNCFHIDLFTLHRQMDHLTCQIKGNDRKYDQRHEHIIIFSSSVFLSWCRLWLLRTVTLLISSLISQPLCLHLFLSHAFLLQAVNIIPCRVAACRRLRRTGRSSSIP